MPRRARAGFTLLEVMLASTIAILLMAGLYVAMDTQLRLMRAGRDRVEQAALTRNLMQRVRLDLGACLTPPAAAASGDSSSTASSAATGGTGAGAAAGTETADSATPTAGADAPFAVGLVGDSTYVTVFASRLTSSDDAFLGADVRRLSYWLSSAPGGGLCRQEERWLTSDGLRNNFVPDYGTEADRVIAPEVTAVAFEYFDGSAWTDTWDGSALGADGATPVGPPRAVGVTLTLTFPGLPASADGSPGTKTVREVIALPTAGGSAAPATGATTTGGTP